VRLLKRRVKMRSGEELAGLVHDWFFVPLRHHFDPDEVRAWFAARGYREELFVPSTARFESSSHFIMRVQKSGEPSTDSTAPAPTASGVRPPPPG
jgi:hypothetical protein